MTRNSDPAFPRSQPSTGCSCARSCAGPPLRAGLTLLEVVMSTLLVSLVLLSALNCVGAVVRSRTSISDQLKAQMLGEQLLSEILPTAYKDEGGLPLFGPELGEPATNVGPRSGYDDVDDFHLWNHGPPVTRTGATLPNLSGWGRSVTVEWVARANPASTSLTDQGVKRITVTVSRHGTQLAACVCLRTDKYSIQ